jgi:transcriptional regulator with XRE-family HTH domain
MAMTSEFLNGLFRRNLRDVRVSIGLSQSELARKMGVAPSYICDLERGRRDPMLGTLAPLADALGVDPDALVRNDPGKNFKIPA